ncbi:hypothetical protein ACQKKX_17320 [Neorhizobium sp. NPDC001467]|uniref:hypothetical protein n=1 Tax=Neorhizobium sp. NPDC001467 TaxID=3390595 RepID=UPI003D009791
MPTDNRVKPYRVVKDLRVPINPSTALQHFADPAPYAHPAVVPVVIYQPYLNDAQKSQVHPQAVALDIGFNTAAASREYELFAHLRDRHAAEGFDDTAFWGLVSTKFELKSVSSFADFVAQAGQAHAEGADAYLYNPLIGCAAIYANVWEQAMLGGHPGMEPIFTYLNEKGFGAALPQAANRFFFCNYMCGNRAFWDGYFGFCEMVLGMLDDEARRGTTVGLAYAGQGHYGRDRNALMRPFVIERLLGLYLHSPMAQGLKISTYIPHAGDFEWKFGPRLGRLLHRLYDLKQSFVARPDQQTIAAWQTARQPLVKQPQVIWQMDDPPAWMPAR